MNKKFKVIFNTLIVNRNYLNSSDDLKLKELASDYDDSLLVFYTMNSNRNAEIEEIIFSNRYLNKGGYVFEQPLFSLESFEDEKITESEIWYQLSKEIREEYAGLLFEYQEPKQLSKCLLLSYEQTLYKAGDYEIKVGEYPDKLLSSMKGDSKYYCFITASNPFSQPLTDEENKIRNQRLEQVLNDYECEYIRGKGIPSDDSWLPEESFLVLYEHRHFMIYLAKMFEQNAIVYGSDSTPAEIIVTR